MQRFGTAPVLEAHMSVRGSRGIWEKLTGLFGGKSIDWKSRLASSLKGKQAFASYSIDTAERTPSFTGGIGFAGQQEVYTVTFGCQMT
eukprot:scaffold53463_cov20-Tisochrysis_lutea.AAC.2